MSNASQLKGNWNYPTTIRFGLGRIRELAEACRELGILRPLLITDPGLADLPMIKQALENCYNDGLLCGLFSDVKSNPIEANVTAGVGAFKDNHHDGVIAFGGGSALDTAKAIALMVGQKRSIWDFEDRADWWKRVNASGSVKS